MLTITNPSIQGGITYNKTIPTVGASTASLQFPDSSSGSIAVGTSAGAANFGTTINFNVTSGTPYTLDLTALTDTDGSSVTLASLSALKITNNSTTTGQDFTAGGGTNPIIASESTDPIQANGGFHNARYPAGITVDSTHKLLQITVAAGTSVSGTVTLLGHT